MSINPYVDINNYSEEIDPFYSVKRFYSIINFKNYKFFTYGLDEEDDADIIPAEGESFYYWSSGSAADFIAGGNSPYPFITDAAWGDYNKPGLVTGPSAFVTPQGTIMPKLAIPSTALVDNGIEIGTDAGEFGERRGVFNWSVIELNEAVVTPTDIETLSLLESSGEVGSKFVTIKYKDDEEPASTIKLHCAINPERETELETYAPTAGSLVGHGACLLMINVIPNNSGQGETGTSSGEESWDVTIDFPTGELSIKFNDTGSMQVTVAGNITKGQLKQSQAKEKPPQFQQIGKGNPYCIVIYPAWNGVVVSDGIQDASGNEVNSTYCPKLKRSNPTDQAYFGDPFDPLVDLGTPENLWGGDGSGPPLRGGSSGDSPATLLFEVSSPPEVTVNFGTDLEAGIDVEFIGCRADIAYLPLFFLPKSRFDQFFLSSVDDTNLQYWQWAYPIWTKNNGNYEIIQYNIDETYNNPTAGDGIQYRRMEFSGGTDSDYFDRYGGEIFGYYFQSDENRLVDVINGDGNYPLSNFWTSSGDNEIGDPSALSGWKNYIESLNVSISLDNSNGSITVDKFGIAGQKIRINQNIGSLKILAYGSFPGDFTESWDGSHPATDYDKTSGTNNILFTGLALGAGDADSSEGGTFNIPLVGRYEKLQDITLINAPFFDGYYLGDVLQFLCNYGGMYFDPGDQYHGTLLTTPIVSSENINSPIVDFKAGTPVLDALNQLCELTHHSFFIKRDGKIHFYELGNDGLPITSSLGYDWGDFYDTLDYNFKINTKDTTPDFADLRNEIVGISQTEITASGSDIKDIPLFPLIVAISNTTNPVVPWAKQWVYPVGGVVSQDTLNEIIENKAKLARKYLLSGNITVPGNPYIEPYDQWTIENKTYIVEAVNHTMDFNAKTWTTSITLFGA